MWEFLKSRKIFKIASKILNQGKVPSLAEGVWVDLKMILKFKKYHYLSLRDLTLSNQSNLISIFLKIQNFPKFAPKFHKKANKKS